MDINVVRVEVKHSTQFGDKKILHVDDGTKWNVAEKKPFYKAVVGPGIYNVDVDEFKGKPYIKYLNFKGALNGQNRATGVVKNDNPMPVADGYKMRAEQDKRRQDDIRLEFYCGLVKDIFIANKKDGEDIDPNKVQKEAFKLFKSHLTLLDMADAQNAEPEAKPILPTAMRAEAELKKAAQAEEDEIPF